MARSWNHFNSALRFYFGHHVVEPTSYKIVHNTTKIVLKNDNNIFINATNCTGPTPFKIINDISWIIQYNAVFLYCFNVPVGLCSWSLCFRTMWYLCSLTVSRCLAYSHPCDCVCYAVYLVNFGVSSFLLQCISSALNSIIIIIIIKTGVKALEYRSMFLTQDKKCNCNFLLQCWLFSCNFEI